MQETPGVPGGLRNWCLNGFAELSILNTNLLRREFLPETECPDISSDALSMRPPPNRFWQQKPPASVDAGGVMGNLTDRTG